MSNCITPKQADPNRPFCCERCKLIDLGAWAMEKYSIPVENADVEKLDGDQEEDSDTSG